MKKVRSFLCLALAIMLFVPSFTVADFAIEANAATEGYYEYTESDEKSEITVVM